jgi:hypothetical protein
VITPLEAEPAALAAVADPRRLPVLVRPQPVGENLLVRGFVAVPMLALLISVPFAWGWA